MGFVLSVFFLVTHYMTPEYLFGSLAQAHIEMIVFLLVGLVSLHTLVSSYALKTPQALAIACLCLAVVLSEFVSSRWIMGSISSLVVFISNAISYFLVCLHFNSRKRLQTIIVLLFSVAAFSILHGAYDLKKGITDAPPPGVGLGAPIETNETASPFFMRQRNDLHPEGVLRLQGLGEFSDPNDFGQLIICVIPLMFFFWRQGNLINNIAIVILPECLLFFGLFETHSRSGLVALIVMAIVAFRRKIGLLPGVLLAGGLFAGAMALQFTGGRDISANAGEDRTALWGDALNALKTHPLIGVGMGNVGDYLGGHTAHNTVAVCASELGLIGLYFWSLFLLPTMRDAIAVSSKENLSDPVSIPAEESPFPKAMSKIEELDKDSIALMGRLILLSMTGYLATAWFLSRAFVMTFFLLGGMTEAIYQMALQRGMIAPRLRLSRASVYAGGMAFMLVLGLYLMVRVLNMMQ
jgi:hypothetical protein